MPKDLKTFLQNNKVMKAGNRITSSDRKYLIEDWNCDIGLDQCVRLNHLCYEKGVCTSRKISLKNMTEKVLSYTLTKEDSIRKSDWSKQKLSTKQVHYAALDAFASLKVAEALFNMSNASGLNEESCSSTSSYETMSTANPNATMATVLLDAFHAIKRVTDTLSRKHPGLMLFARDMRDAIFVINDEDRNAVETVLLSNGSNFDLKLKSDPSWVFQRVRRTIPQPDVLMLRIQKVIEKFKSPTFNHSVHGSLIKPETEKQVKNLLLHIRKGCLSDPVNLSLYRKRGYDSNGLQLYKCLRGTNTVELWHQFIEMRYRK
jgi:hypothetical protein